ncbi:MAG: tetratricopeptide repeat protein [Planctomycetes bacterium]|nr:tetratricopeptide repeat protein [Planctomycetota bacterium]
MCKKNTTKMIQQPTSILIIALLTFSTMYLSPDVQGRPQQQNGTVSTLMPQTAEIPIVRTVSMNIHYQIDNVALQDLERVELWYGRGLAGPWERSDSDLDKTSPVRFLAPAEGIFRFLIIATDRWGRRSCQSQGVQHSVVSNGTLEGIPPHLVVFIDYTSPILSLFSPRGELLDYNQSELEFRWASFDSNLTDRPVQLFIQQSNSTQWTPISGPLEASGDFTWKIPAEIQGSIRAKAVLSDRAGNSVDDYSGVIHLTQNRNLNTIPETKRVIRKIKIDEPNTIKPDVIVKTNGNPPETPTIPVLSGPEIRKKTAQHILRGNLHLERREWLEAITAFEQALNTDPGSIEARANLANVLLLNSQFDQAQLHFGLCLDLDDSFTSAWYGLAQAQIAQKNYLEAKISLDKLLQMDPKDFQSWYLHGNVAEKLGLIDIARSSWEQAAQDISPVRDLAREALNRIS